jgi:hypothetical protein
MRKLSILTALTFLVASSNAILNGDVSVHKPYYARVSFRLVEGNQNDVLNKAGTILSDRFVLTTGSFFFNSWDIRVWVGSNIRQQQEALPGLTSLTLSSHPDGPALIQLANPLTFSLRVQSIRIIPNDLMGLLNEQGMVVGMGGLVPGITRDQLHAAFLRIISPAACATNYPGRDINAYFCAFDGTGRSDFCPEDRGAAFTVQHRGEEFLVGIGVEGVCSILDHSRPSLFASISHFRARINEILDGRQGI